MKRTFYLYKYRKNNSGNIHKDILKFIKEKNKSLAVINQDKKEYFYYTITSFPISRDIFFSKATSDRRPVCISNPLISSFEGEDNSMFPMRIGAPP